MSLPIRVCLGCEQADDHPRHVVALQDGTDVFWHMDCHAVTGCAVCAKQIEGAEGATGDTLRTHLTTKDD